MSEILKANKMRKKIIPQSYKLTQLLTLYVCVFTCSLPVVFHAYCLLKINTKWTNIFPLRFYNDIFQCILNTLLFEIQ